MRYLILILTLLFSFNVKAESYSCSMSDNIGTTNPLGLFTRYSNQFIYTNNIRTVEEIYDIELENDEYIILSQFKIQNPGFFSINIINKIENTISRFHHFQVILADDFNVKAQEKGICMLIP